MYTEFEGNEIEFKFWIKILIFRNTLTLIFTTTYKLHYFVNNKIEFLLRGDV